MEIPLTGLPATGPSSFLSSYGDALFDLADGVSVADAADVILRGNAGSEAEREFVRAGLQEAADREHISREEVDELLDADNPVITHGVANWKLTRALASLLDRRVKGASGATVALVTRDVYRYLRDPGIGNRINDGVRKALTADTEMVVVGHSLGSVVAYALLAHQGEAARWKVPLLLTLGCPLAVTVIRNALAPIAHPTVVAHWHNARDPADIVALHPLIAPHFDIKPAVEHSDHVSNGTDNRHGIEGYLSDQTVARRIHDALISIASLSLVPSN